MNKSLPVWRRLLQFRLRSLLLLVLLGAVVSAWYAHPRNPPRLGLDGYCPVTLLHKREWQIGDPQYDAVYNDRLYVFVGARERNLFESYPDRYAPICAGADVVRLLDEHREVHGERAHGVTYHGHIYLFDSETTLEQFWATPDRYANLAKTTASR